MNINLQNNVAIIKKILVALNQTFRVQGVKKVRRHYSKGH